MDRTQALLSIRPKLSLDGLSQSNKIEQFQNNVLRPILKLQHDYLCFSFLTSSVIIKQKFENKHEDQKKTIIIQHLKSDTKIKSLIVQSIVSMMTIEELKQYQANKTEYKKRIVSMASQRLIDGLIIQH